MLQSVAQKARTSIAALVVTLLVAAFSTPGVAAALPVTAAPGVRSAAVARVASTQKHIPFWAYTYYTSGNSWKQVSPAGWTSGYLPGELWNAYQLTGDSWYRDSADTRQEPLGASIPKASALDIGQRYFYSFAQGYGITGHSSYRTAALKAAASEAGHFDPKVGASYRSATATSCDVIIDNLMNVQLLTWAADNGGPASWRELAHRHALTVARDFIRPDGSTYHVVTYDRTTGAVLTTGTAQGYSASSMWARGQAWAIYGFSAAYRSSRDPVLLDAARRVADRYLTDLPADQVPYWDFDDPAIPAAPKDSSAAAIAASGLFDLAATEPDAGNRDRYRAAANDMLAALASPQYFSAGGVPSVLLHGTLNYWSNTRDCGLSFGDYFFLEALVRQRSVPTTAPAIPVKRAWAKSGKPYSATDRSASTAWVSKGSQWIDLDLRSRHTMHAVGVAVRYGDSRCAPLKVSVSADRKHWKTVARAVSSGETRALETYTFGSVRARFVRLSVGGTSRSATNGISQLRVY